jgi:hypothetical protein
MTMYFSRMIVLLILVLFPLCIISDTANSNFDMALVLISYDMQHESYLRSNMNDFEIYISVENADLPADHLKLLQERGLKCHPESKWVKGNGMKLTISKPSKRPDGNYDVSYDFYCGGKCASGNVAILKFSDNGWEVISSEMQWIS